LAKLGYKKKGWDCHPYERLFLKNNSKFATFQEKEKDEIAKFRP
jgi:hypothetical protein